MYIHILCDVLRFSSLRPWLVLICFCSSTTKLSRLGGHRYYDQKQNRRKKKFIFKKQKKTHNIEKKNVHTNALTFTTFDIAVTGAMKLKGGKHQLNVILVRSLVCVCVNFSKQMNERAVKLFELFLSFCRA